MCEKISLESASLKEGVGRIDPHKSFNDGTKRRKCVYFKSVPAENLKFVGALT